MRIRLKYLCSSFSTPITQDQIKSEGRFAVYGASGIVGYKDDYASGCEYLGIIKDGAGVGRVNYYPAKSSLLGTLAYIIPIPEVNIFWLKYVVQGLDLGKNTSSTTIPHIYFKDYGNKYIELPSKDVQQKIASFLDEKCSGIDLVLEQMRASIEEYKKMKQSVITRAVTRGIRAERSVHDSGDKWVGVIPEEWRVTQLRHCASVKSGITLGKTYPDGTDLKEMPYLRVANVQDGYVDISDMAMLAVTDDEIEKYRLHSGDVLMTEGGDRDKLGRGCVWDARIEPCLHQNHIFAVKTNKTLLNPYFLEYVTASKIGRTYFDVTAIKTTNLACTSSSKVMAFVIPLPSLEEQAEIVAYLKEKCGAIDNLISKKELVISELTNYKKSMIYEYVTGKKEVPQS